MSQLAAPSRPIRRSRPSAARRPASAARKPAMAPRVSASSSRKPLARPAGSTVVTSAGRTTSARFGFVIIALVFAGVMGLLLLNTARAEQSFTITKLQSDVTALQDQQQALSSDLDAVSTPEQLSLDAAKLGMVRASSVKYVDSATHKQIGVAPVVGGGDAISVNTLPNTPASRAAQSVLDAGTVGQQISTPAPSKSAAATPETKKADAKPQAAKAGGTKSNAKSATAAKTTSSKVTASKN